MDKNSYERMVDEIEKALGDFPQNIDFAVETSSVDETTKGLVRESSKMAFYMVDQIAHAILDALKPK